MKRRFCIILILLISFQAAAQTSGEEDQTESPDYEPYAEEEFPDWVHELRRAEVIFIGSFPLTMLFTSLAYEGIRLITGNAQGTATAGTAGFGNEQYSTEETKWILITGGILSAAVAAADFILGRLGLGR